MPKYFIYPTLLDAFQRYLTSEEDDALEQFLNKVNRVPFFSEAADKGTKFNQVIDFMVDCAGRENPDHISFFRDLKTVDKIKWEGYEFKSSVILQIYERVRFSRTQVFTEGLLETSYGTVKLYGFIDNLQFGSPTDIKTTGRYEFPKYLRNWQHIVYPYCLISQGVQEDVASVFTYEITDFNNTYREEYIYNAERDVKRLKNHCEHLIQFLEMNRDKITDKKIFGLHEQSEKVPAA